MGTEAGNGGVERVLSPAEDEDKGALFNETFCCGEADTRGTAGDHSGLSTQSVHGMHPSFCV